jgi:flagellar L-ring protein precursor FlgH|tara:strand:+ start:51 stop:269 length:219 start_codon:yes stop_codon:yes gene_type:complete
VVILNAQEVWVNFEKQILTITGIVRPKDISATNIIKHIQIAEARIAYSGAGQLTDVQQPRHGQQIFDVVFPF